MRLSTHATAAAALVAVAAVLLGSGAGATSSAQAAPQALAQAYGTSSSTTLIANGSFEGTLADWGGYDASLSVVSGGVAGTRSARVTGAKNASMFSIYATPRPVE